MKKNILIATGGSGGHIMPAIVFYNLLDKRFKSFISSDLRGLNYLNRKNYNPKVVKTPQIFNSYLLFPFKIILVLYLIIQSLIFLRKSKIDVVFSTGGYAPIPLCIASLVLRKRLFIYEPNHVIGKSNKFFLPYCHKIFCHSYKIKFFPKKYKNKIVLLAPIVRDIFKKKRTSNIKGLNLMIIGGSQGAKIFDKNFHQIIFELSKKLNLKIIHQTNVENIKFLKSFYNKCNIKNKVFSYSNNIFELIKKCNFCITRGGSSTLAELFVLKIPFLVIPLKNSKDNHQFENAKFYKNKNCCWILDEHNLGKKKLYLKLNNILLNKKEFTSKKKSLNSLYQNIDWNKQKKIILNELNEN